MTALIASVVIAAPSVVARRPKVLELGAVVAFVGFTVVAFVADPSTTAWLARYARAIAALLLAYRVLIAAVRAVYLGAPMTRSSENVELILFGWVDALRHRDPELIASSLANDIGIGIKHDT